MANIFYDKDADLSLVIRAQKVAIIGYGSQGHAHALNLRDSRRRRSRRRSARLAQERAKAEAAGLHRRDAVAEAAAWADVVMHPRARHRAADALTPRRSRPHLRAGQDAHVRARLQHPLRHDHAAAPTSTSSLIAPKGPGHRVRETFAAGGGVPALFAVHQDATGKAPRAARSSYATGIGATRAGVLETTFAEETETDLFGEQAVLCGGVSALVKAGFETLIEAGYQPEVAYFECMHELKLIVDLMYRGGLNYMRYSVSDTAEYGDYVAGPRVVDEHARGDHEASCSARSSRASSPRSGSRRTRAGARRSTAHARRRARPADRARRREAARDDAVPRPVKIEPREQRRRSSRRWTSACDRATYASSTPRCATASSRPGATMTSTEKLEVARALARLGVDVIEAGLPGGVARRSRGGARHRRARSGDARRGRSRAADHLRARPRVGRATSTARGRRVQARARVRASTRSWRRRELHMKHKLRMTPRPRCSSACATMVALRAQPVRRRRVPPGGRRPQRAGVPVRGARGARSRAGATTLNIPDTVGYTTPDEFGALIARHPSTNVPGVEGVDPLACTATTTSGWRRPTRWPGCAPARARPRSRSTASASAPATRRSRRS